jgi:peptidoglycan/xylan/chitin deacetylase (PgdA/CDA1 family)
MLKFTFTNIVFSIVIIASVLLQLKGFEYWLVLLSVAIVLYFVVVFFGIIKVKWQFFMPIVCRLPNNNNNIFLSFDDGPHEKTTAILDLLKEHKATGNFFCVGSYLAEKPLLAKRLVDEGHFIGNHTYSHSSKFPIKSGKKIAAELHNTNAIIEKYTRQPCLFFRPPYGVTNPTIARIVEKLNLTAVGWSIRSFDTVDMKGTKALNKIKNNLKSGDIVLLHDYSPQILFILKELLCFLKKNNFNTKRIDDIYPKNNCNDKSI